MTLNELTTHIKRYVKYLNENGRYSPRTITAYETAMESFLMFVSQQDEEGIELNLDDYTPWLRAEGFKDSTIAQRLIALRQFIKYLNKRGNTEYNVEMVELPRLQHSLKETQYLPSYEVDDMIQLADKSRDKAIIMTLFTTGLRVSELLSMYRSDLIKDKDDGTAHLFVRGKRGKERVIFISPRTLRILEAYLRTHGEPKMFPYTARYIGYRVADLGYRALDRKGISPHTLRHSFATHMRAKGVDIRDIQAMLGHTDINTTMIYSHVSNSALKKVHEEVYD